MPPRPPRPKQRKAGWQTRESDRRARQPIVIVGFGRMGGALGVGLHRAGWKVSAFPRSAESLRRAANVGVPIADQEAFREAGLCLLAVPDAAVREAARSVLPDLGASTALVHCAGALSLGAFGDEPEVLSHPRGSFHPLVAVSDPRDDLSGHTAALSATTPKLMAVLRKMAADLQLRAIEVPEANRAAYHAGAVLSAGGLVALASAAVSALGAAGISEGDAVAALLPLMRSALRGVEQRGLAKGLTGPVVRGDAGVVRAHLAALPPDVARLYRELSRRALELAKDRLSPEVRDQLAEILAE